MNWNRGLARIYVVICVIVALAGIWFATEETKEKLTTRTALAKFLKRHQLSVNNLLSSPSDSLIEVIVRNPDPVFLGSTIKERFPGEYDDLSSDELASRAMIRYPHVGETLTREQVADSISARPDSVTAAQAFTELRHKGYSIEAFPDTLPPVAAFYASAKYELSNARALAERDEAKHPLKTFGSIWGTWALLCLAAPAVLFLTIRWISTGFSKN